MSEQYDGNSLNEARLRGLTVAVTATDSVNAGELTYAMSADDPPGRAGTIREQYDGNSLTQARLRGQAVADHATVYLDTGGVTPTIAPDKSPGDRSASEQYDGNSLTQAPLRRSANTGGRPLDRAAKKDGSQEIVNLFFAFEAEERIKSQASSARAAPPAYAWEQPPAYEPTSTIPKVSKKPTELSNNDIEFFRICFEEGLKHGINTAPTTKAISLNDRKYYARCFEEGVQRGLAKTQSYEAIGQTAVDDVCKVYDDVRHQLQVWWRGLTGYAPIATSDTGATATPSNDRLAVLQMLTGV
ncbi:hypothetical protein CALVIDRAFT_564869 [Calocera viscosa TUFC12733]|uniref:Uncharacterized protein n=1 Tax=Calocera viscosa (strain TUFC12733) TaxID=1330018 RepID=A0A167L9J5_CALVF|nr:hypothetical protein CALVIDRAFT_564869 [Calocera viscosa TUFC12733]